MLLMKIKGPKSFEDLRTINGTNHATYREACIAMGLLADDSFQIKVMEELFLNQTNVSMIRKAFVLLILIGELNKPYDIFTKYCLTK